jgi:hypothetical protein
MQFPPPFGGDSERRDVRYGAKADVTCAFEHVRLVPEANILFLGASRRTTPATTLPIPRGRASPPPLGPA